MKGRSLLLALPALVLALGCENPQQPNGLTVPNAPSLSISDAAHDGNPDFFFLPPLVPLNRRDRDFELGQFNHALQPVLAVEICQLNTDDTYRHGLPTKSTQCVPGDFVKEFAPGEVLLVNLRGRRDDDHDFPRELDPDEWWEGHRGAPEGFYYVLWNTSQSDLDVDKFYRITVRIDGSDAPLGFVDVDPRSDGHKWKYSRSGQIVKMIDGVKLPIPFRVERGALCPPGRLCNSVAVTRTNPNGLFQLVTLDRGAGAIAGAKFPNGWLPSPDQCPSEAPCPQTVVVTISSVNTGVNNRALGTQSKPCHADLEFFEQFDGCFNFTTTPELAPLNGEAGDQFVEYVTVAACYVLQGTGDPREKFAQMYSSGPNEETSALPDVSDAGILAPSTSVRRCGPNFVGFGSSNPLMQFASTGWRKLKGTLGGLFAVNTAYAVDLGLGGITKRFSNIGAAVPAEIRGFRNQNVGLPSGVATVTPRAQIIGSHDHAEEGGGSTTGINGVWVTFSVEPGNGTLRRVGSGGPGATRVTVFTSHLAISQEEVNADGIASVSWTPPAGFNTYQMTATGPATGSPVTFTARRGD
jgi:hypothetical protein